MAHFKYVLVFFAFLLCAACTSSSHKAKMEGHDRGEARDMYAVYDPLESANRVIFDFNLFSDRNILRPVAKGYEKTVPVFLRDMIRNFLRTLKSPLVLANNLFQGDIVAAGDTLGRTMTNVLIGIGGLFDPASQAGLSYKEEDFGQTLAVWGVDSGPYLVLPFLGSSTLRDSSSHVVGYLFDPLRPAARRSERFIVENNMPIRAVMTAVDSRSRNYRQIERMEETALDPYSAVRSLYYQHRASMITNGNPPQDSSLFDDDFDDDFEDVSEDF